MKTEFINIMIISIILNICSISIHAQNSPSLVFALTDSAVAVAREDTAIALQRMFFEQRRKSRFGLVMSGIVGGTGSYLLATDSPGTTYQHIAAAGLGLVTGYYLAQLAQHIVRQRQYRPSRERQLLTFVETGQPLPRKVRRKLAPSYLSAKLN